LGISKTIGSFETKTDVEISSYPKYHVAISPDGKHVVTFDTDTLELSTCMIDSLDQAKTIKYDALSVDTTLKLVWSLAVSNSIDTHETEILIALSCFDEHTMMLNQNNNNIEEGQGSYDNRYQRIITNDEENCYSKKNYSETWIFSTRHTKRITTTIDEIGGLVKFLNNDGKTTADDNNHASVIVLNATGIYKTTFNVSTTENELKNNGMMAKIINSIDDINNMLSLFFNDLTATPLEEFSYPPKIQMELKKLYQNISCLELLSRSIENDYFLVEDYKNRIQVVEMYNLNTSKLDMIFHQHEDIVNTSVGHGSPAVSISTHKTLLAYCRGSNFMSIYLMENSLEIASRQFNHLEKILSIDFVNDDESLLIIAVEKERSTPVIIVWDLFTYFNDSIRILKDSSQVFPSSGHRLVRSSGKILLIDEMGKLKSILKDESLKYLLKPNRTSNELIELPLQELYESEWDQAVAHTVFDQSNKYDVDNLKIRSNVIAHNKEPWNHNRNYNRISAFLNKEKTLQLFIGESTVQVWYKKKLKGGNDSYDPKDSKSILKYIWTNPTKEKAHLKSLKIGDREFIVRFEFGSNPHSNEKPIKIHWPYDVNAIKDACSALHYFYTRRDDPAGPKKQQQFEDLIAQTETIVVKFIKRNPSVWKMIDVRYEVMANLISGRLQVWYKKKLKGGNDSYDPKDSKSILKYIWTNPTKEKAHLKSLKIGDREFIVRFEFGSNPHSNEKPIKIHWPYDVNAIKDACSALHYFYTRRDDPAGPKKQQQFEDLIAQTETIVVKFIKRNPSVWKMIDVRYEVMANLISGRRISLIQNILKPDKMIFKNQKDLIMFLHTPRLYEWPRKPKESDLEVAIKCSEKRHNKDLIIVSTLLDYYSENAMDNTGWMFSVSRAIPLLLDHQTFVKDLFSKPCFGAKEIHVDESYISPGDLPRGKSKYVRAFDAKMVLKRKIKPVEENRSTKNSGHQLSALQKVIPGLDRANSSSLIALRLAPLPDFTVYPENVKPQNVNYRFLPLQLLKILIWPRNYTITKDHKLSPFIRTIRKDKNGITLDNPSVEAIIDFKWRAARNHFIRHCILYSSFALLFGVITGAVKNKFFTQHQKDSSGYGIEILSYLLTTIFYYLGYYLLAIELVQFRHEGWRRYFSVYNFFDIASVIMPLAAYSVGLIRAKYDTDDPITSGRQLTIAISFTILVMWFELFLLLRFFSITGYYIYIIINIVRIVWPFIAFMCIVVLGFGHAMYVLLRYPDEIGVAPDGNQYQYIDPATNATVSIDAYYQLGKINDNQFSNFFTSVFAVYFWINGRWDQLDQWMAFVPANVLSIGASVLLVIILQNMLIAFMTGVFDDARHEGRHAVLRYRADLISDYETLEKPFGDRKGNPRHIFYIGDTNKFAEWL
ncbi:2169_t:CDS:2, partial [Entrophospora sp. SA101]